MNPFAEGFRADRRLVLLRLLSEQPGYRSNSSILWKGLDYIGIKASRDDVNTDLYWLRDQGLVRLEELPNVQSLIVAQITDRGDDVAAGRAIVPGVSRPSPK